MNALSIIYTLSVVWVLVLVVGNYKLLKSTTNLNLIILLLCGIVANAGYAWSTFANDLGEALACLRFSYLGGLTMGFFMFTYIANICKVNIPKWINYLLLTSTFFTMAVAMTIGKSHIFYDNAELAKADGYSYLIKTYGPLHEVYKYLMLFYMIFTTAIAIRALFKPTMISRGVAVALALSEAFTVALYFGGKLLHLKLELLPFAYCVALLIATNVSRRAYLYNPDREATAANDAYHDNGVVIFDNNKRFLGSNAVAKDIFPEIEEYHLGKRIPEGYEGHEFFGNLINTYVQNLVSSEETNLLEKNDEFYKVRIRPLVSQNNESSRGYIIEMINYTESQKYINRIQQMNSELEVAAEEAKAANKAKSNFLASMSHEIRTPINAVIGLNSIIMRDTKEDVTREYAQDVYNAGRSLLSLINDILDFSKVEAGKMDLVPVNYQLSSLLNDCQNMLYSKVQDKGLKFELVADENVPSVLRGDEVRIRQIIINLLTNAVKYTESGTVTLKVNFEKTDDKNISLKVAVSDTGMGISEENQKHLFESFKRVDEENNRNIEGTGLGLSLVQTLTSLMNGEVFVESELGKGSTFCIIIPQEIISDVPMGKVSHSNLKLEDIQKMDDLSETKGKLLVVDDVPMNLKVFVRLLAKSKLDIATANGGAEAIQMSKEEKYDIIFLDHMMPEIDGIEALHQIRAIEDSPNKNTPIVMLTANAIEGVKEQYINEGFDDYLSKPINFNPLKDIIQKYLK